METIWQNLFVSGSMVVIQAGWLGAGLDSICSVSTYASGSILVALGPATFNSISSLYNEWTISFTEWLESLLGMGWSSWAGQNLYFFNMKEVNWDGSGFMPAARMFQTSPIRWAPQCRPMVRGLTLLSWDLMTGETLDGLSPDRDELDVKLT